MAILVQRADQRRHGLAIRLVGRARRFLDLLQAERLRVLAEHADVLIGVGAKLHARLLGADDGAIVDMVKFITCRTS